MDKKTFEREIRDTIKTYKRAKRDQRTVPTHLCFRGIEDHKSTRTQRHRKSQMKLHTMTVLSVQMRKRIEAQHQPSPRNVGLLAFASDQQQQQQQHSAVVEHDNTIDSQCHNGTGMLGSTAALCIDVDCEATQREEHFIRDDDTLRHTSGWAIERALEHGKRDHEGALRYLMEDDGKDDDNSTDENCNDENNNNNNTDIIVNNSNNQISNDNTTIIVNNNNNNNNDYNINNSDIDKRVMGHDLSLDSSIPLSAIFEQAQVEPDPIYSMPSIPQQQLNTLTTDVNVAALHKPTTVVVSPPNGTMTAGHWQPQLSSLPNANNNDPTAANYVMLFGGRTVYPVCRGL